MSFKRHRAQSEASSSSSTSATETPTSKVQRTTPGPEAESSITHHPLLCTLPPTCNHSPTPIANSKDLETHYATYHAHVCEESGCNCVFPDARLLEIHQTECHDPLAAVRKDKGEKIFACHLASCARLFLTPKARRLHLIQGHGYPKEYYFAVTNKGVGGLLKRWGEGASLMRGQWKPREPPATSTSHPDVLVEEDDDDEEDEAAPATPHPSQQHPSMTGEGIDSLADSLNALSLVPPSIRFGRGGKNGGFANDQQPRGGRAHRGRGGQPHEDEMDVDVIPRGARGRGRGAAHTTDPVHGHNGKAHASNTADPDVLAYVPRGVRARGMLNVRGGTSRGKVNHRGAPDPGPARG
ncbi:hypothetical protein B0H17DRAFT_1031113 [Mycena rosella]|uniref:C2H2-type domain-containing protein n=1 Tax=Mycena rosella TaxID=1033263 RepID=A0AAD7MBF5_MYCRO|nr:hypothetical protein B0H17DRAFT_1031113 [Mycena rosella]